MDVINNKNLQDYSTLGIPATAQKYIRITNSNDIHGGVSYAKESGLSIIPIGDGSNTVLSGGLVERCLLDIDTSGIDKQENDSAATLQISAGEAWDDVVNLAVSNGWAGITAMSAIPGSVGAAPVQNIGAYGQELSDVLERVKVYDLQAQEMRTLAPEDCEFGYRTSLFKQNPGRFIVLSITVTLEKRNPEIPDYGSVADELKKHGIDTPTHQQLRNAITDIRWSKLPQPEKTPNVGSFFANPFVPQDHFNRLQDTHEDIPGYQQEGEVKIPAGWLVEEIGMKGEWRGSVGVSDTHALVIVSKPRALFADLARLIGEIRQKVRDQFSIDLEREPRIL